MPEAVKSFLQQDWWKPMAVVALFGMVVAYVRVEDHIGQSDHPEGVIDKVETVRADVVGYAHQVAILEWRVSELEKEVEELTKWHREHKEAP